MVIIGSAIDVVVATLRFKNIAASPTQDCVVASDQIDVVKPLDMSDYISEWSRVLMPCRILTVDECAGDDSIITQNHVRIGSTIDHIVAICSGQNIVSASEIVFPVAAEQVIVPLLTKQKVIAALAMQRVVSGTGPVCSENGDEVLV